MADSVDTRLMLDHPDSGTCSTCIPCTLALNRIPIPQIVLNNLYLSKQARLGFPLKIELYRVF